VLGLVILFAILAIIFGVWGFGFAAATAWAGVKILFWVFIVLLVLSLFGWGGGYYRREPLP